MAKSKGKGKILAGGTVRKTIAKKDRLESVSLGDEGHRYKMTFIAGHRYKVDTQDEYEDVEMPPEGHRYSDDWVAEWLSNSLGKRKKTVLALLRCWRKPILRRDIPGFKGKRRVTPAMFAKAQQEVLRFYAREERKGTNSHIVQAFRLASGEKALRFCWTDAVRRVKDAKLDYRLKVDGWSWGNNYAMTSGDTNATGKIFVSGHRRLSKEALTSLICHEGLHNFAKRVGPGNPWLSCDVEHEAMALLGDPQLPVVL